MDLFHTRIEIFRRQSGAFFIFFRHFYKNHTFGRYTDNLLLYRISTTKENLIIPTEGEGNMINITIKKSIRIVVIALIAALAFGTVFVFADEEVGTIEPEIPVAEETEIGTAAYATPDVEIISVEEEAEVIIEAMEVEEEFAVIEPEMPEVEEEEIGEAAYEEPTFEEATVEVEFEEVEEFAVIEPEVTEVEEAEIGVTVLQLHSPGYIPRHHDGILIRDELFPVLLEPLHIIRPAVKDVHRLISAERQM